MSVPKAMQKNGKHVHSMENRQDGKRNSDSGEQNRQVSAGIQRGERAKRLEMRAKIS
jgi:hypothetical protein